MNAPRQHPPRLAAALASACLLLTLAGCGGHPARDTGAAKGKKTTAVQKRGGAYYKDDGPADETPGDLDAIPDARPRLEPLHRGANRPYVVLGRAYTPNTALKPMRERGIASWYGRKFHGQKTSIGETYDMFAMTAAHPTLALPSYARVTNLGNGRSVVVRLNDRGPFHAGRIIDLSYAAARRLGYADEGRARVEVEALLPGEADPPPAPAEPQREEFERLVTQLARQASEDAAPPDPPPPPADEAKGIYLQLGAFSSAENAEALRAHLARELDWLDDDAIRVQPGESIHRVQLGPYPTRPEAAQTADRIRQELGYQPGFVTVR
ncbi:MAG: septal ring lytic transglycosylase RlpA family protein [Candidatus Accumulibacter sp.]|jgi:rare lipoprotein A|nr:septal ring lytic transglycosylase RlpA family protein [Accumulibacter sp.]